MKPLGPEPGPRILVARHGQTDLNQRKGTAGDVVRGQLNPPLVAKGRQEARQVAAALARSGITRVFVSPLTRTRDTGKAIAAAAGGVPVKPQQELLPWDMGEFEGVPSDIARPLLKFWAEERPTQAIPGGESFDVWTGRALPWLRGLMGRLVKEPQTVCLVTHSRCIKLYEGWLADGMKGEQVDLDVLFHEDTNPGEVYDLAFQDGRWRGQVKSGGTPP